MPSSKKRKILHASIRLPPFMIAADRVLYQAESTRRFPATTDNLDAQLLRLAEALSDVLATPESVDELSKSVGEETTNKCVNLKVALQKAAGNAVQTRMKSSDSGRESLGSVKVPAFRSNTLQRSLRLPPLPPIPNIKLQSQVFTHSSRLDACRSDSYSAADLSYERLEFIGDAYIECIASRIIFARFPSFPPGNLSQIRESLVKNETLAGYAVSYGFDQRIEISRAVRDAMLPKSWIKTLGAVFEAYVAAIVLSTPDTGFAQAESWLASLWEENLAKHEGQELNPRAKSEIMKKLMGKGIKVEFREEQESRMLKREGKSKFFVGVYLTGWGWKNQHLGSGVGYSKGEAGVRAAMEALVNVPLIDEIAAVKKAYDEEVKTRQELEHSGAESQV